MIVPPALLSRGHSELLGHERAFLCLLLETANMRVVKIKRKSPAQGQTFAR
jgi:hypothetical protein